MPLDKTTILYCLKLSADVPSSSAPASVSVRVESSYTLSIQRLALAFNRAPSLHDDPTLGLLIKSTLRPVDHYHLNEVEMDEIFDNAIHFALKGALCTYAAQSSTKP